MTRVILTTVGTSLKMNAEKFSRTPAELLREDPVKASAESNALSRILGTGDVVELFHSQTQDGEACGIAIALWMLDREHPCELRRIDGLTYQAKDFHRGMRSLARALAERIRDVRNTGDEPVLVALGGFKAEVAYATLIGALFGLPNYYIHQDFDELLDVPALPVSWDFALIDGHADVLGWLKEDLRTDAEARTRLAAMPDSLRGSLLERDEGYTVLSPLGEAYYEAYLSAVETAAGVIGLSDSARRTYDAYEPAVKEGFDRVLRRLRVPGIRRNGSERRFDVLVFPRGHVDERVFWMEVDGVVYVLEMARHEDGYRKLNKRGVRQNEYENSKWTPWMPSNA